MENFVFNKWTSAAQVADPGIQKYINLDAKIVLHNQGRHTKRTFGKSQMHIVERLINTLMRGGTGKKLGGRVIRGLGGCGKKIKMYETTRQAFEEINQKTGKNPVEVLVKAIENAAPREETTRVKYGGAIYHLAVDIAPQRRIDFALRNIGKAVAIRSFKNKKTAKQALVEELMMASQNDAQSHAISRKIEVERVAKSSR
jgi:small subunit ribosomal protein S7